MSSASVVGRGIKGLPQLDGCKADKYAPTLGSLFAALHTQHLAVERVCWLLFELFSTKNVIGEAKEINTVFNLLKSCKKNYATYNLHWNWYVKHFVAYI